MDSGLALGQDGDRLFERLAGLAPILPPCFGMRFPQLAGDQIEARARLFQRRLGLEPSDDEEPTVTAAVEHRHSTLRLQLRNHHHRYPQFGRQRTNHSRVLRRRYADHRQRLVVDRDRFADQGGVGAEAAAPQTVADHHHRMRARRLIFLRQKCSTTESLYSEQVEIIAGDRLSYDLFHTVRLAQFECPDRICRETGEYFTLFTKDQKILVSGIHIRSPRVAAVKLDQLFGPGYRTRAEDDGVDDAEDRRIRADTQRQRQYRNHREAGLP